MKKSKKVIKLIGFMILWGIIGAIVGGFSRVLLGDNFGTYNFSTLPYILISIAILCGIISLSTFLYVYQKSKSDAYSNDEDGMYEKHEYKRHLSITLATLMAPISFGAFGISLSTNNENSLFIVVFLACALSATTLEVLNINLMKKVRREKKADPLSLKFQNQVIEEMDEMEEKRTGRAATKCLSNATFVYLGVFLIGIIFALSAEYFIAVMLIWILNHLNFNYQLYKQKK